MQTHAIRRATLVAAVVLFATAAAHAALRQAPLLPAGSDDLVPDRLVAVPAPPGDIERTPVAFAWPLDPSRALAPPGPHLAESREYWMTVDGDALARGVELPMTAGGAMLRVSPAAGARPIDADAIEVRSSGAPVSVQHAADAAALRAAGMPASRGTTVLKLDRVLQGPSYTLRAASARGRYVVHVYEPGSPLVLRVRAARATVLGGDVQEVRVAAENAGRERPLDAEGLLVAPDGSSRPITVRTVRGEAIARVRLPTGAASTPGLWELQVFATVDGVPRDARTAFAVSAPTAKFAGTHAADRARLRVDLPVLAAAAGRYEVRGTLYATAPGGDRVPVSQAHAAAWFDAGHRALALQFDRAHLPAGHGAPFEVRQLELRDQGRHAPLEIRRRAVRF
jgi:hypothetical protein